MATSFWTFKAPSTHEMELAMRAEIQMKQAEVQAKEAAAEQKRRVEADRDHEAWKRQLLRDRNVTIHASTNQPSLKANDSSDNTAAFVVGYVTGIPLGAAGLLGAAMAPSHSDSSSSDSSSTSSDSSSSGGTE